MKSFRELTTEETKQYINTKNRYDLYDFLSQFSEKVFRVETKNITTGEGYSKLYLAKSEDEVSEILKVKLAWIDRVKG